MRTIILGFNIANSSVSDFFLELSNQLSGEFKIIIISNSFKEENFFISPQIEIFHWPSGTPTNYKNLVFLYRKLKEYNPITMISVFGAVNPFLILGCLFNVKNRIAWCRSISKQFEVKKWKLKRKKYIYELASVIYANSHSTKKDLVENYGINEIKIEVFYNAVKDYKIQKPEVQKNKLVYVGRMSPSKRVDVLLKAMPAVLLHFPDVELKLIGGVLEGEEILRYKKICQNLRIQKNVFFVGNKSKQNVLEEFATSYLTIVPSIVEAFGFVVIESFSVSTPVIGSRTSGIAEIIRDGIDGFLFKSQDEGELANNIITLLENENLRNAFSENCYQRFQENFELNKAINELKQKFIQLTI